GTITSWNRAAERLYGYTAKEIIGQSVSILMPNDLADDFPQIMSRLRRGERIDHYETARIAKDGRRIDISLTISPIRDRAGHLIGASAIARDISERKRVEAERQELLGREQAARKEAEQAQKLILEMLAREEEARSQAEEALIRQRMVEERLLLLTEASATLMSSLSMGPLLSGIIELAGRFSSPDALAIWRYLRSPNRWEAVSTMGLPESYKQETIQDAGEAPTLPATPMVFEDIDLEPLLAGRRDVLRRQGIRSVLAVPLSIHGESSGSITFYYRNAKKFSEDEIKVALALGNLAAAAITMAELYEEQSRLREEAQQARIAAETASRVKDEFLATVSHELRTPLNAILGWAGVMRKSILDASVMSRAIEIIERNAKSQSQLIEDLLDVSRIITGKLRLDVGPVELAPVIEAALDVIKPTAEVKGVRLEPILDTRPGLISGDSTRLQQVVWNLLSNAVKFTPRGGRVMVRLERNNSRMEITVSDTGQGISPQFLPYVFDRFRQADSSFTRQHGGLGLGLAIVRHLVELHGGSVEVYSPGEGKGATFKVRLPLMLVHGSNQPQPGIAATEGQGRQDEDLFDCPPMLDGLQVLVVEDESDARDMMRLLLEECGAKVKAVASVAEALEAMRAGKPDVVLSDIEMPGEDGYSFIRKVRALPPDQGGLIPAVALTAHARSDDRLKTLGAGYQAHVAKPVSVDELLVVIASVTGRAGRKLAQ
ncbi:MAG TPA: ATP-binding protein, partial [Blastocatellia bacterium]|nr:ATP-binding protein [Blastocatellia bacterium]